MSDAMDSIIAQGPGRVDFSPLGDLFKNYTDAQTQARQTAIFNTRKAAAVVGADGQPDFGATVLNLLKGGDVQGASELAQIAHANKQTDLAQKQFDRPQFNATVGRDQFSNPIPGFVNPNTQTVTPVTAPGVSTGAPAITPLSNVNGQAFLDSIDKPIADQVKALAEGRMAFPAGTALKSPYWQSMLQKVSQYDPSFDAVNYNARAKTRADFTSGNSAKQINAMNTVAGHFESLSDAAEALNNSSYPAFNTAKNYLAGQLGDPSIKQFDATKKAVIDELTRVWRGNGGSEGDIKSWSDTISSANSPQQLRGVIAQIGELVNSKINALGEQYKQGMGTTAQPIQLVTPKAQAVFQKLQTRAGNAPAAPTDGPQAAPQGTPAAPPDLPKLSTKADVNAAIQQARDAIAAGADRGAVLKRLRSMGIEAGI